PIASGANPTVELSTGTHTIFLAVHDERGASSTDVVSVTVMPSSVSFTTTDDAFVRSRRKNRNFGSKTTVRVKKSSTYYSFFKFNVTGLGGAVLSAKIRLKVRNGSDDGGSMYTVSDNGWDEGSITWNNAPSISGSPLSSVGNVSEDDVVEFDVTSAISGDGVYSFGMKSGSNDIARYSSKEGATPPELVIESSAGGGGGNTPPVADAGPDQTVTDSDDSGFEDVTLDGSGSSDPDGTIASYEWKEGATVIATGVGPTVSLAVGSHTLLLTVTDNMGDTAVDVVEVNVNPGSSGDDVAFTPTDDAYVRSKKPTKKYGHSDLLQVRRTSKKSYTFLKFNVTGLSGIVQSAKIRLKVTDSSNDGGTIYTVSNAWDEGSIIWNNAPSIGGSPLSSVGSVSNGDIVEFDVSSAISGNGVYSFGIKSASKNKAEYSSKEGVTAPELVIALAAPPPMLTVASNGALMIDGLGLMTFMKTGLSSHAGKKGIKLGKDSNGHVISGNDNLDVDPQFEDPSALNWRLQAGSPVIDKAKADIGPEVDLELLPRSENNDMIDIGAFERRVNSPIVLRIPTGILGQFPIPTPGSSRLYP
ncbi:MAG: DNRLRE domain-containing protein, partial [bacterium]